MTGSALATLDWNRNVIALLVIGSIHWLPFSAFDVFFACLSRREAGR